MPRQAGSARRRSELRQRHAAADHCQSLHNGPGQLLAPRMHEGRFRNRSSTAAAAAGSWPAAIAIMSERGAIGRCDGSLRTAVYRDINGAMQPCISVLCLERHFLPPPFHRSYALFSLSRARSPSHLSIPTTVYERKLLFHRTDTGSVQAARVVSFSGGQ